MVIGATIAELFIWGIIIMATVIQIQICNLLLHIQEFTGDSLGMWEYTDYGQHKL